MSKALENLDRRAFLRGLTVTAAGLLVPKPIMMAVPVPLKYKYGESLFESLQRKLAEEFDVLFIGNSMIGHRDSPRRVETAEQFSALFG